MSPDERHKAINLLFANTINHLDELRDEGLKIPSDVYVALGDLRGSINGIVDHFSNVYDAEINQLLELAKVEFENADGEPEEPLEGPPESDKALFASGKVHNVVNMRKDE